MKTQKLKLFARFLLLLPLCAVLLGVGCEKEDVSQSILEGKWILMGFGDDSTNEFIPEPDSEPKSSYVIFDNGDMVAYSLTNRSFDMKYLITGENKLSTKAGKVSLAGGDTQWGQRFLASIGEIFEFDIQEDILKLYYEDQKFMK